MAQINFVRFYDYLVRERGEGAIIKIDIEGAELGLLPVQEKVGVPESFRVLSLKTRSRKSKTCGRPLRQSARIFW